MRQTNLELDTTVSSAQHKSTFWKDIKRDKLLYLLLIPGIVYLLIFRYIPMYGVVIAFQDYNIIAGISGSVWVAFEQFERLFRTPNFSSIFMNTLIISSLKLLFGFPAPIILALLLNELRHMAFKRFTQSVIYLPHFISWVIFAGIIITFLNPVDGLFNYFIKQLGGQPISFLTSPDYFRSILVISDIYKEMGWGTIIYLAAMTGVRPDLYEAARIDGANRFKQMWHVTLPAIRPVILIMLILSLGNILEAGFLQIYLLYSPLVYDVADVIDTYVYRRGIQEANYSLATAAGLFKSIIALILIVTANKIVKKFGQDGLW
ncbi:ABC transporter permease [Halalkalibacter hemicellulosilyticus]|uniref:Binding-protein-dependent transport systems inner membrane component n=1 Tax=Halalkalibacter hemicellulosilyticusJCM 9152 TaxID=1236971 RepID=W4QI78_9BACI|nr:sugar ABC transporter permease [Halalkalibacter hemicellulosilyticus]GAE31029.1 binding-protein-dependent transport systems inner membrane component [Halalkalibacter hemicellulosilyticusJCM 9152]